MYKIGACKIPEEDFYSRIYNYVYFCGSEFVFKRKNASNTTCAFFN